MNKIVPSLLISALTLGSLMTLTGKPAEAGYWTCQDDRTGRQIVYHADPGVCPDGIITMYHASIIRPFTRAERARMNARTWRAAKVLARRMFGRGQINAAQLQAVSDQRCVIMAAGNPDVRCVPGTAF